MPQFYVAVGFAMQLTLRQLRAEKGFRAVFLKQLRRSGTLYLISLVFYGVDDQKTWALLCDNWPKLFLLPIWNRRLFQSLNIIGVTQLIIVPVITRPVWVRVCFMFASMAIYIVSQWTFYMKIQWKGAIDGGAFGAFSWAFVMLAGSILTDWNEVSQYDLLVLKLTGLTLSKDIFEMNFLQGNKLVEELFFGKTCAQRIYIQFVEIVHT